MDSDFFGPAAEPNDPDAAGGVGAPLLALRLDAGWWRPLERCAAASGPAPRARLAAALIGGGWADAAHAAAHDLLAAPNPYARALRRGPAPAGLERALRSDLERLVRTLRAAGHDAGRAAENAAENAAEPPHGPPLTRLAPPPTGETAELAARLRAAERAGARPGDVADAAEALAAALAELWRAGGAGPLRLAGALGWDGRARRLRALPEAAPEPLDALVGLERQLGRLTANVEAFLAGRPALHTLLYGPRGSGKSSAVKALLPRYRAAGLRLLELPPDALPALPEVVEAIRGAPQRVAVYVDDLAFDAGDDAYRPLKSLLEGSVAAPPDNALVIATSNRRHLVAERHEDRPEPGSGDPHGWDTHHERLALADRFGLAITFPSSDQRRYLEIARARAEAAGRAPVDTETFERAAIRFAEWGNGYSGRSAAQFVAQLRSGDDVGSGSEG